MDEEIPFRFEPRGGFLQSLHPLAKLAALLALSGALMAAPAAVLAAAVLLLSFALASAGYGVRDAAAAVRFVGFVAVFAGVAVLVDPAVPYWLDPSKAPAAGLYVLRLLSVYLLAETFFRTTPTGPLGDAATALSRSVLRRADADPGLYVALTADFLPRVFEAYARVRDAAAARGFGFKRPRLSLVVDLLEAFVASNLRAAVRTARALEARCYHPARSVFPPRFRARDGLVLAAAAACAAGAGLLF